MRKQSVRQARLEIPCARAAFPPNGLRRVGWELAGLETPPSRPRIPVERAGSQRLRDSR